MSIERGHNLPEREALPNYENRRRFFAEVCTREEKFFVFDFFLKHPHESFTSSSVRDKIAESKRNDASANFVGNMERDRILYFCQRLSSAGILEGDGRNGFRLTSDTSMVDDITPVHQAISPVAEHYPFGLVFGLNPIERLPLFHVLLSYMDMDMDSYEVRKSPPQIASLLYKARSSVHLPLVSLDQAGLVEYRSRESLEFFYTKKKSSDVSLEQARNLSGFFPSEYKKLYPKRNPEQVVRIYNLLDSAIGQSRVEITEKLKAYYPNLSLVRLEGIVGAVMKHWRDEGTYVEGEGYSNRIRIPEEHLPLLLYIDRVISPLLYAEGAPPVADHHVDRVHVFRSGKRADPTFLQRVDGLSPIQPVSDRTGSEFLFEILQDSSLPFDLHERFNLLAKKQFAQECLVFQPRLKGLLQLFESKSEYKKFSSEEHKELWEGYSLLRSLSHKAEQLDYPTGVAYYADYISDVEGKFLESNRRLIFDVVRRYSSYVKIYDLDDPDTQDLIQEMNKWLLEAVRRYDFSRGFKFVTYANWYVRRGLYEGLRGNRFVYLSQEESGFLREYLKKKERLGIGDDLTYRQIAESMAMPEEDVWELEQTYRMGNILSLDQPSDFLDDGSEEVTLSDTIPSPTDSDFQRVLFLECLDILPERSRSILLLRREGYSQVEVGKIVGLSPLWVRTLEKEAIVSIKDYLKEKEILRDD